MLKLLTVIGARPQFIKAATVSRVIAGRSDIEEIIVHTGQHYDENMSQVFFDELSIPKPDYNLSVGSLGHGAQTGRILEKLEEVLIKEKPDWLLIYGDTNSTLAGALAASKLHIPVAHVEAGLRSFNRAMPEEINRVVADHVSSLLFAPTEQAINNLKKEGVSNEKIVQSGDVMLDAALYYSSLAQKNSSILDTLKLSHRGYVLATIHRAENTDNDTVLNNICDGLNSLAKETLVVLPLHPRTKDILTKKDMLGKLDSVTLIEPAPYLDMIMLERSAKLVVTDSGGVQKEAYFFDAPCITLRPETEWVELVESGWNKILDPNTSILSAELPDLARCNWELSEKSAIYGDGHAARHIVEKLLGV
ncbi:non-hydrolyzing UDP-N-acetylglucosamine 2-epimerase [Pseudomonadota bacterium]